MSVEGSCPYNDESVPAEAAVSMGWEVRGSSSEVLLAIGATYRLNLTIAGGLVCQLGDCLDNFDLCGLASGLTYMSLKVSSPIFSNRQSQGWKSREGGCRG